MQRVFLHVVEAVSTLLLLGLRQGYGHLFWKLGDSMDDEWQSPDVVIQLLRTQPLGGFPEHCVRY